ncbi:sialate O-acetylesterase [Gimesia maris]|uniref:sialate O-acetylesterase n=1 Tax=Gimesia maris TaxID=122 RepID=UPI00241E0837|nr:sialate O-acetylesterase [Gimesia maris]|tara:strand:+ start:13401 stop:14237 length:837 start_codon:yes stop_codon:yes gene_type:complete
MNLSLVFEWESQKMKIKWLLNLTLCLGMSIVLSPLLAADKTAELPEKEKFHIYLLIGQSNMAGRGKVDPASNKAHPRVLKLDKAGNWVPATDPLHFDKPKIAGVGPGSGFGPVIADAYPEVTIGLIPAAVGGTPLSRWVKGGDLYERAVKLAKENQKKGVIKGAIWHQGEGDSSNPKLYNSYQKRLSGMIADLRTDLGEPEMPFVMGELGEFFTRPGAPTVNQALHGIAKEVPATAVASSKGLPAKSDQVHFNAESEREFGKRYAAQMLKLQKQAAEK